MIFGNSFSKNIVKPVVNKNIEKPVVNKKCDHSWQKGSKFIFCKKCEEVMRCEVCDSIDMGMEYGMRRWYYHCKNCPIIEQKRLSEMENRIKKRIGLK